MRHWRESRRGAALAALCLLGLAGCGGAFSSKQEPLPGERRALRAEASAAAESSAVGGALGATRSRADAPQLQGDAAHSGGHLAGPAAPRLSWTAAAVARSAQGRVAAAPVVAQGRIYALGAEADIAAMNAGDGHVIWRADLSPEGESGDDGHGGGLAFADGRLYATTGFGELLALDGASGDILWRAPLGAPARGPGRLGRAGRRHLPR